MGGTEAGDHDQRFVTSSLSGYEDEFVRLLALFGYKGPVPNGGLNGFFLDVQRNHLVDQAVPGNHNRIGDVRTTLGELPVPALAFLHHLSVYTSCVSEAIPPYGTSPRSLSQASTSRCSSTRWRITSEICNS